MGGEKANTCTKSLEGSFGIGNREGRGLAVRSATPLPAGPLPASPLDSSRALG